MQPDEFRNWTDSLAKAIITIAYFALLAILLFGCKKEKVYIPEGYGYDELPQIETGGRKLKGGMNAEGLMKIGR